MGAREDVRKVSVTEPITLDDLRWLVEHCDGLSGQSQVGVSVTIPVDARSDQPVTITVLGEPAHPVKIPPGKLKVYRAGNRPGNPADDDQAERRW